MAIIGLTPYYSHLPMPSSALITWNWSFTTDRADQFGSGTFTTAAVTPVAFTTYDIIGIAGTYHSGGNTYPITGLFTDVNFPERNRFQWDGGSSQDLLLNQTNMRGLAFSTNASIVTLLSQTDVNGFAPASLLMSSLSDEVATITSLSLSPQSQVVPGPLPVVGLGASLSSIRRLRHCHRKLTLALAK
ncbi:MAG: hypothetical protein VKP70_04710 [Cyanobacteriota bacterium]|nr:hypothetical protein [Cyanobacteriota bacterium]